MRTDDFDYHLPPELIAQTPLPRGESRLLVLHRSTGRVELRQFVDLLEYVARGDTLVVNDSRVSARRLSALRESGGPAEVLLLRPVGERRWEALVRPGRRIPVGSRLCLELRDGVAMSCSVVGTTPQGGRVLELATAEQRDRLRDEGTAPLPPYIHEHLDDEERYQTVYARADGSAAAPTAGLHFTPAMLAEAEQRGVGIARITLHIGVDTFRPVKADEVERHEMHGERFTLDAVAAETVNSTRGRVIAVGTTAVRALESAAVEDGTVAATVAETRLFITPGYRFRIVEALLTNFHLPRSTLLMLVSALAGRDNVMAAYRTAVENRLRFFSFGDAMLIV